jgi:2-amino-4-hydroxy-6-hydroxymethyldihydropteridine diphosphokinase
MGDRVSNLLEVKTRLANHFGPMFESRIWVSNAAGDVKQPFFFNQVLQFKLPDRSPKDVMNLLLELEFSMGRVRNIPKGPRPVDLDIIFWGHETISMPTLTVPHPLWNKRAFVVYPLRELPFYSTIEHLVPSHNCFSPTAIPFENIPQLELESEDSIDTWLLQISKPVANTSPITLA